MTDSQDRPILITANPVEIDSACKDIHTVLNGLTWIDKPYFIAKRFVIDREDKKGRFIYPETYAPDIDNDEDLSKYPYHRLTPDSDYKGMFFFFIGKGTAQDEGNVADFLTYDVNIIFSVNLKLVDNEKLKTGVYTRELMSEARRTLKNAKRAFGFQMTLIEETDDLKETYRDFVVSDIESYNRLPLQCFRLTYKIKIRELCI